MTTHYETLGIANDATQEQIKTAFRKLAKQHHPDMNPDDAESEKKFKEINEAYGILSDEDKRRKYDLELSGNQFYGGFNPDEFQFRTGNPFNIDDILGAFTARRTQKNSDIHVTKIITLEQAFSGIESQITARTSSGNKTVSFKVPAGIDTGARIRLAGQGDRTFAQFPPGDLLITIAVAPHSRYARHAQNLTTPFRVDAIDAMLGARQQVETIDGSKVDVSIPPGVQHGQRLRLTGHGMPIYGGAGARGDLLLQVEIAIPILSDKQLELLRAIRDTESSEKKS